MKIGRLYFIIYIIKSGAIFGLEFKNKKMKILFLLYNNKNNPLIRFGK